MIEWKTRRRKRRRREKERNVWVFVKGKFHSLQRCKAIRSMVNAELVIVAQMHVHRSQMVMSNDKKKCNDCVVGNNIICVLHKMQCDAMRSFKNHRYYRSKIKWKIHQTSESKATTMTCTIFCHISVCARW